MAPCRWTPWYPSRQWGLIAHRLRHRRRKLPWERCGTDLGAPFRVQCQAPCRHRRDTTRFDHLARRRQLRRTMTGGEMAIAPLLQYRHFDAAAIDDERTARMEAAARGWVHRTRHITAGQLPRAVAMRVG